MGSATKQNIIYNPDAIISVGYRVKSLCGTQFRIWATQTLKKVPLRGCAMTQLNRDYLTFNVNCASFDTLSGDQLVSKIEVDRWSIEPKFIISPRDV